MVQAVCKQGKKSERDFFALVYDTVRKVPEGRVTTYSSVARALGSPRAARAVGWAMRACSRSDVPCHRVVRSDGFVSGYREDARRRILLLKREGIKVEGYHLDVESYLFDCLRERNVFRKHAASRRRPKGISSNDFFSKSMG